MCEMSGWYFIVCLQSGHRTNSFISLNEDQRGLNTNMHIRKIVGLSRFNLLASYLCVIVVGLLAVSHTSAASADAGTCSFNGDPCAGDSQTCSVAMNRLNDSCAQNFKPVISGSCSWQSGGRGSGGTCQASFENPSCNCRYNMSDNFYDENPYNNYPYGTHKMDVGRVSVPEDGEKSVADGGIYQRDVKIGIEYNHDGQNEIQNYQSIFELTNAGGDGKATWNQNAYFYSADSQRIGFTVDDTDDDFVAYQCENGWESSTCWGTFRHDGVDLFGGDGSNAVENVRGALYDHSESADFDLDVGWHDIRFLHWENTGGASFHLTFINETGSGIPYLDFFHAVNYGEPLDRITSDETSNLCKDGIDNDGNWNASKYEGFNSSFYSSDAVDLSFSPGGNEGYGYKLGENRSGIPTFGQVGVDCFDRSCGTQQGPPVVVNNASVFPPGIDEGDRLTGTCGAWNDNDGLYEQNCTDGYDNDFDGKTDYQDRDCAFGRVNPRVFDYLKNNSLFDQSDSKADAICSFASEDSSFNATDQVGITKGGRFLCVNATDGNWELSQSNSTLGFLDANESHMDGKIVPSHKESFVAVDDAWKRCAPNNTSNAGRDRYTCQELASSGDYRFRECCAGGDCENEQNPFNNVTRLGSYSALEGASYSSLNAQQLGLNNTRLSIDDGMTNVDGFNYTLPAGQPYITFSIDEPVRDIDESFITINRDDTLNASLSQQPHNSTKGYYKAALPASADRITSLTFDLDMEDVADLQLYHIGADQGYDVACTNKQWRDDYDDSRNACGAFLGENAWTGSYCCGDDINVESGFAERYNDSQRGCWFGQSMSNGRTVSSLTRRNSDDTVLYENNQFWDCNSERSTEKAYTAPASADPLLTEVANYTQRGDHICEPEGWRETLQSGELFTLASVLQNYTQQIPNTQYSIICGNADDVVNDLTSENSYDGSINACVLRTGGNELQGRSDKETIVLFDENVSEVDSYLTDSGDFFSSGYNTNTSACTGSGGKIDLQWCQAYPGIEVEGSVENQANVHVYADLTDGYTAVTSDHIDQGAFRTSSWSLTNNPVTEFFGAIWDTAKSVFQSSELPFESDARAQALYVTEQEGLQIASGIYTSSEGKPYLQANFDGELFTESGVERTMQRYYTDIDESSVGTEGSSIRVNTTIDATDTISLWKQMTVSYR